MDVGYAPIESSISGRDTSHKIDSQIIKTHYPRDNNDKLLSIVIQEEPNLCLDFNSIMIGCRVKIPNTQLPENGFALKLFKNMNIEINSQLITSTKAVYVLKLCFKTNYYLIF